MPQVRAMHPAWQPQWQTMPWLLRNSCMCVCCTAQQGLVGGNSGSIPQIYTSSQHCHCPLLYPMQDHEVGIQYFATNLLIRTGKSLSYVKYNKQLSSVAVLGPSNVQLSFHPVNILGGCVMLRLLFLIQHQVIALLDLFIMPRSS